MTTGIVIVVLNPDEVLADEANAEMGAFVRVIAHAGEAYTQPIESGEWWDRPAVPFHILLQSRPANAASVRARWQAAGMADSEFVG